MAQATDEITPRIRSTMSRMEMALGSIQDAIVIANSGGNIQWYNQPFARLVGQPDSILSGANLVDMLPLHERGQDIPTGDHPASTALASEADVTGIYEFRQGDKRLTMEVATRHARCAEEGASVVLVLHDISERHHAQEMLVWDYKVQMTLGSVLHISLQPPMLKEAMEKSLDALLAMPPFSLLKKGAIFIASGDGNALEQIVARNLPEALQPTNTSHEAWACGQHGRTVKNHEIVFTEDVDECHGDTHSDNGLHHGCFCTPILAGNELLGVITTYVEAGHVRHSREDRFLKMFADTLASIIQRKRDEERLERLAHLDNLTGLPNRPLFFDRLHQAIAQARRQKKIFAVFFLDLDRFKEINDTLGHEAGDTLLKESARRMLRCVREMDSVARMGGDEFTFIILADLQQPADAAIVAKRVLHAMEAPFVLKGEKHHINASIGISIYPDDGNDPETMVRHADTAMYEAKKEGNTYSFFSQKG